MQLFRGLVGVCFAGAIGFGATIVDQPTLWQGNLDTVGVSYRSSVNTDDTGFQTFDTFRVSLNATINRAVWYGIYLNTNLTDAAPSTIAWDIGIYSASLVELPVALLTNTTLTAAQVTAQAIGVGVFGKAEVTVYRFTANITPFNALAGQNYAFSPYSRRPISTPDFYWIQGTNAIGGGTGLAAQRVELLGNEIATFLVDFDRAFTLSNVTIPDPDPGTTVPEPTTSAMVGLAFAAVWGWRRRARL